MEQHPWIQRWQNGLSNLFVNKTKSIIAFKISKFTSSLKYSSPYSRIRVTTDSLLLNTVLSISLILFRIVQHETRDSGKNDEMLFLYQGYSFKEDPEYLATNLIPFGLWYWKIFLGAGLTNFKILFSKTL